MSLVNGNISEPDMTSAKKTENEPRISQKKILMRVEGSPAFFFPKASHPETLKVFVFVLKKLDV